MIVRDKFGIIVQHDKNDPNYLDGGDSANREGVMAYCGDFHSTQNLVMFCAPGGIVRHPWQVQNGFCSTKKTSRDCLVMWSLGLLTNVNLPWAERSSLETYLKHSYKWRVNKDLLLSPGIRLYLKICAGVDTKFDRLIGKPFLWGSCIWACHIEPDHELNTTLAQCCALAEIGDKRFLKYVVKNHPDWQGNLLNYWGGWRDQIEIGIAFINKIQELLK